MTGSVILSALTEAPWTRSSLRAEAKKLRLRAQKVRRRNVYRSACAHIADAYEQAASVLEREADAVIDGWCCEKGEAERVSTCSECAKAIAFYRGG